MGAAESTVVEDGTFDPRQPIVEDPSILEVCCNKRVKHRWAHDAVQWTPRDDELQGEQRRVSRDELERTLASGSRRTSSAREASVVSPRSEHAPESFRHPRRCEEDGMPSPRLLHSPRTMIQSQSGRPSSFDDKYHPSNVITVPALPEEHAPRRYHGPVADYLFHICPVQDYMAALVTGVLKQHLSETVQCATNDQRVPVAKLPPSDTGYLLLKINSECLTSPVTFQSTRTGRLDPHVLGLLNLSAVVKVYPVGEALLTHSHVIIQDIIALAFANHPSSQFSPKDPPVASL